MAEILSYFQAFVYYICIWEQQGSDVKQEKTDLKGEMSVSEQRTQLLILCL